ncbi:MAG: hypothetical protein K2L76_03840 [Muribaculaceae bacterium]|nr:hypothetical protein [Muribaculaceae bacterium]
MAEDSVAATDSTAPRTSRPCLTALPGGWPWAVAYLLSLSALGLRFYPAVLAIICILAHTFVKNRYAFVVQLTLLLGGYALTNSAATRINLGWLAFFGGFAMLLLLRKNKYVKHITAAWGLYAALLLYMAVTSEESMRVQMISFIGYITFIYFLLPMGVFAGRKFDFDHFVRAVFPYALTICVFYILDAYVFSGWVLVPCSHMWGDTFSAFNNLVCVPLSGWVVRKYPPGLYMLAFLLLPLARSYSLRWWQWAIILASLAATQTFTVISGYIVLFLLFQGGFKRVLLYGAAGLAGFVALYFVDASMAYVADEFEERSPLRIKTSVDQILDLTEAVDDEDIAEFGSGRIAQAIPKLELLYDLGYQWRGFGFLSRFETDNPKFIVENEYYRDREESIEVATNIEITALQILVTVGYIGLAAHILFFAYTWWVVRRMRHATYYLSVLLCFVWFGLSGFEGLISFMGVMTPALALSATLLSDKTEREEKEAAYATS